MDNEINKKVKDYSKNKYELQKYYNVGKLLLEAGKHYGEGIIKKYSIKLTNDLGKGYTPSRLRYYRRFYDVFSKCPTVSDKLSYSHYCEIMWLNNSEINYYIKISIEQNLSVRKLREKVKNNEYERLPEETKNKLKNKEKLEVEDLIKNPIIIKNSKDYKIKSEKALKRLIIESIEDFMKKLGNSYSFIGSEYKIKIGEVYNYIDILLFNYEYNFFCSC